MILPTGRILNKGGMTLVEVLVSVAILSCGVVLVLGAFDSCVTGLAAARDAIVACVFLDEKLSTFQSSGPARGSGETTYGREQYKWRLESRLVNSPDNVPVSRIEGTMAGSGGNMEYSLVTYGFPEDLWPGTNTLSR